MAAQSRAAEGARRVARKLKDRGLSDNDVAAVLKVSRSRAQQLARPA
jgi:SOS response regulatory protein OraA/RecX